MRGKIYHGRHYHARIVRLAGDVFVSVVRKSDAKQIRLTDARDGESLYNRLYHTRSVAEIDAELARYDVKGA